MKLDSQQCLLVRLGDLRLSVAWPPMSCLDVHTQGSSCSIMLVSSCYLLRTMSRYELEHWARALAASHTHNRTAISTPVFHTPAPRSSTLAATAPARNHEPPDQQPSIGQSRPSTNTASRDLSQDLRVRRAGRRALVVPVIEEHLYTSVYKSIWRVWL